jgi:hypothetical protein
MGVMVVEVVLGMWWCSSDGSGGCSHDGHYYDDDNKDNDWLREPLMLKLILMIMITLEWDITVSPITDVMSDTYNR